jgi:long-chain acyl-CoA synthetase
MQARAQTINELFNSAVARHGDSEFLRFKRGDEWRSLTHREVAERVKHLALGLYEAGIRRGDRLAIWSENRPEWNMADLAALALGAVDVPIYTTQARAQVEYILADSGARAIFVSSAYLPEAVALKERLPSIEMVIAFDAFDGAQVESLASAVVKLDELMARGKELSERQPDFYDALWRGAKAEELATLLYTSGTTGDPKGVMLTHKNLTTNTLNSVSWLSLEGRRDVALTYLPLSHIFERAVWYVYMHSGAVIAYAESIEAVSKNLAEVRPTVMTSVPRMFEKIYARIVERGMGAGFPRKQIFLWSLGVARRWAERRFNDRPVGALLALQHKIADLLVYKKWREALGGQIRSMISGGAPLAPEIGYVFSGAGLLILQGYGLTETSPSISCNTESRNRIGTVGPVMDNVSVKIAEDGEILVKGDTVMRGYYNRPSDNENAFTEDGWFRTGDIGHLDADGFLVITDRKKELIKTSGGKYIAPQQLESLIKSSRFVSQVVVVGDGRKFASVLVVPNFELLSSYAEMKGIKQATLGELVRHPKIIDLIERQIDKYTADVAQFEKIKRVALLERELTTEAGELTPTLKPRRSVIEKKYAALIDGLYEGESKGAAAIL